MKPYNFIFFVALLSLSMNTCKDIGNPIDGSKKIEKPPCPTILPPIVPPSPYDSPIWHPSGLFIGFNHNPLREIRYPYREQCFAEYSFENDSAGFWLIAFDGTDMRRIFPNRLQNPSWSPDGQWIAFNVAVGDEVHIFKMRFTGATFDTTTVTQLTSQGRNFFPAWSPDGQLIAYDRSLADVSGPAGVWIMEPSGSQKRFVAQGRMPTWTVDSGFVVYVGLWSEIYRVNAFDTSNVVRLTSFSEVDPYARDNRTPKFSPDGTTIAFWSKQSLGGPGDLWMLDSSGTNIQQLTHEGADATFGLPFSWSPNGAQIVYTRYRGDTFSADNGDLWILNVLTGERKQLTFNAPLIK